MSDYDETTAFLGHRGLFQKTVFFLLCVSMVPNGFGNMAIVFVGDIPKHHCFIPQVNLTEEWLQAMIPIEVVNGKEEQSRCSRYRLDVVRNLSAQGYAPSRDMNLTDLQQEHCVDGWSYSTDIYQSTIVSEFDLVCGDRWKQAFTTSVYFIGIFAGSFFSGQLSDRFGRKPIFFITMAVQALFMFLQVFSTSWMMFTILMFFSGVGQISNYVAAFVLGAEVFTGNTRVLFLTLGVGLAFASGYVMLPLFAYFLRDWRFLQLTVSLPSLLYVPLWWFVPESPRWLLSQGRVEEAEAIVRKAADMNKVEAPPDVFQDYNAEDKKSKGNSHRSVFDLFRTNNIRTATMILCFLWFSMTTGYYGLSLNTSKLTPDPYLGCFIAAAVEIPAYIGTWLMLQHVARQICSVSAMVLGGGSLLLLPVIPQSLPELSITLEMIGKFSFAACTNILFAYTAEVFPTVLRNTATGTCSTFARIGACLSPFILQLSVYFRFLPYVILGTLSAGSAIAAFFLPETFRRPLPETIEDMQTCKRMKCPCVAQKETETVHMEFKF